MLIGKNPAFITTIKKAQQLRRTGANVLITGESGTGKELFARLIHENEDQPNRPFVAINCGAIPQDLLESVLFGHEKGAFSGAHAPQIGKFELASGGDIFLDEIGTLAHGLQTKLLRVLQEKEVDRIGARHPKKIDFRVISATNTDIAEQVAIGEFRSDLYFRIKVVHLAIPPLRDRPDDIPLLIDHFLRKFSVGTVKKISASAIKRLITYHWPGNIRELENVIHRAVLLSLGRRIEKADIQLEPWDRSTIGHDHSLTTPWDYETSPFDSRIKNYERRLLIDALERHNWNKSTTSRHLGISRNRLYKKMEDLKVNLMSPQHAPTRAFHPTLTP